MTYGEEIKIMRQERDTDSFKERQLTRSLLSQWKEIRDVRTKYGFTNISNKLVIRKESVSMTVDKQKWDADLKTELRDEKEVFESTFEQRMKTFEQDMNAWMEIHSKTAFFI